MQQIKMSAIAAHAWGYKDAKNLAQIRWKKCPCVRNKKHTADTREIFIYKICTTK